MDKQNCDEGASQATNEYMYTIKGCEEIMTGSRGKMWVLSDPFTMTGLTWQLQIYPHIQEEGVTKLSIWLVLLDVQLLPADQLPYVRCSLAIINQVDRDRDLPSMMNAHYTAEGNPNQARRCLASLPHARLLAMRAELMPSGDMHLRVRMDRVLTAQQRAVLCKCSVQQLLGGGDPKGKAAEPEESSHSGDDCQRAADWVAGLSRGAPSGSARAPLGAAEATVRDAIASNRPLCQRINRVQSGSAASEGYDFEAAVHAVQNMLGCQGATAKVMEYFGGEKPHAALVMCFAVDPAGLQRHISTALGPQGGCVTGAPVQMASSSSSDGGRPSLAKRLLRAMRPDP